MFSHPAWLPTHLYAFLTGGYPCMCLFSYADADDQALAFLTRAVVQRDEAVMYELADLMLQTKKGPSLR